MNYLLALAFLVALPGIAQTPPATATPNFCDQSISGLIETSDHRYVGVTPPVTAFGLPWADVKFNHDEGLKVLDVIAKEQNKNGPYTVTVTEVNACDNGPNVRISSGSIYVEGVTLGGLNKIGRAGLKMGDAITKRYEDRDKQQGNKPDAVAWQHKNAGVVDRDSAGQVVPPGQAKKQQ